MSLIDNDANLRDRTRNIDLLLKELKTSDDSQSIAKELSALINATGLSKREFNIIIDLIIEEPLSAFTKNTLINSLLPNNQYLLSRSLIYRIISNIGIPEIYFKDSEKQKSKTLATSVQQNLLQWLICSIHLFGPKAYNTLNKLLPILFNLLSYEFSRPFIANLIFLSVLNSKKTSKIEYSSPHTRSVYPFKPWHVQIVVDLFTKFPLDSSLRSLLVLFKTLHPALDYNRMTHLDYDFNSIRSSDSSVFRYPKPEFLEKLNDFKILHSSGNDTRIRDQARIFEANLKHYNNFAHTSKRRKRNPKDFEFKEANIDLDILEFSEHRSTTAVSVNDCNTMRSFVNKLDRIKFINVNSLFDPQISFSLGSTEKFKYLYLITQGLLNDGQCESLTKLEYYVRLSILDDNFSLNDLKILFGNVENFFLASSGNVHLSSITDFLSFKYDSHASGAKSNIKFQKFESTFQRVKLLKYLPIIDPELFTNEILQKIIKEVELQSVVSSQIIRKATLVSEILLQVSDLFSIWYKKVKSPNCDPQTKFRFFKTLSLSLPTLYSFIIRHMDLSQDVKISVLSLFNFIKSIEPGHFQEFLEPPAAFVPPTLLYRFLFSPNPLLVSEVCGFVAYIKPYRYPETMKNLQSIQNTYVMDTLNFLWRDKAFHLTPAIDSSNKAFLLPPQVVHSLGSLPTFNIANLVKVNTVGNVFHNPSFSLISAEIVWKFEDECDNLSHRHAGPVQEESVLALLRDPKSIWLELPYDELKLRVLRELDRVGYTGLCDLLFTSLKTLMNRREL